MFKLRTLTLGQTCFIVVIILRQKWHSVTSNMILQTALVSRVHQIDHGDANKKGTSTAASCQKIQGLTPQQPKKSPNIKTCWAIQSRPSTTSLDDVNFQDRSGPLKVRFVAKGYIQHIKHHIWETYAATKYFVQNIVTSCIPISLSSHILWPLSFSFSCVCFLSLCLFVPLSLSLSALLCSAWLSLFYFLWFNMFAVCY